MFYKLFPIFAPKSVKTIAWLKDADSAAVSSFYTNLTSIVASKKITGSNTPKEKSPEEDFFDYRFVRYVAKEAVTDSGLEEERDLLLALAENKAYKDTLYFDALQSTTKSYQELSFEKRRSKCDFFHKVALAITKNDKDLVSYRLVKLFVEDSFLPSKSIESLWVDRTKELASDLVVLLGQAPIFADNNATKALEYARVFMPPDVADCTPLGNIRTIVINAIATAYPDALDREKTKDPTLLLQRQARKLASALPK